MPEHEQHLVPREPNEQTGSCIDTDLRDMFYRVKTAEQGKDGGLLSRWGTFEEFSEQVMKDVEIASREGTQKMVLLTAVAMREERKVTNEEMRELVRSFRIFPSIEARSYLYQMIYDERRGKEDD